MWCNIVHVWHDTSPCEPESFLHKCGPKCNTLEYARCDKCMKLICNLHLNKLIGKRQPKANKLKLKYPYLSFAESYVCHGA